jgi:hypothetical protein
MPRLGKLGKLQVIQQNLVESFTLLKRAVEPRS